MITVLAVALLHYTGFEFGWPALVLVALQDLALIGRIGGTYARRRNEDGS